jgi:DNA-binding LytR/AlgR family response regulator
MAIRCIIVDDEPLAIDALSALLKRFSEIEIIATCPDAFKAFEVLQKQDVDLVFLDINMPEMSGLSFLKSLQNPPKVIFTTAHREYAFDAFELDVVDYLLKPVSHSRLMKSISKFHEQTATKATEKQAGKTRSEADHIFIRAERKMVKVFYDDILYVEGLKDYVKIITNTDTVVTKMQMGNMEKILPDKQFIRCHRSYIVNRKKITAFTKYDIEIGKIEIPIGSSYSENISEILES